MAIHTVEISVPGSVPSSVEIEGGFGPAVVEVNQGPAGPNSVTSATTSDGTAELTIASLSSSGSILCTGIEGSIEATGANAVIAVSGAGSAIIASGSGSYIETSGTYRILNSGAVATLSATLTENRAISFPDRTGTLAMGSGTNGAIVSADVSGLGTAALVNTGTTSGTLLLLGTNGAISTSGIDALISTSGEQASISTTGEEARIFTTGTSASIVAEGANAHVIAAGQNSRIYTQGDNGDINTQGANAHIYTAGGGYIQTSSTFKITGGGFTTTISGTQTADRAIAFPDASGTLALTSSNVATAAALQTARTIFGQSFNGTANVGGGTITLANNLTTSGNFALTLTTTATTNVTLPTTGTLATLAGTETLTNKTINAIATTGSLTLSGTGASGLFGLRSTSATGYSSMELLGSGGSQMGGFGYANSSASVYADQVYFYSASKRLNFGVSAGGTSMCVNTSGGVSIGTTTDAGANNLLVAGSIINPTASTSSGSTPALIASGPTSAVDTLQVRGTTTASYSSVGFIDSAGTQRGSFGYGGSTASGNASTVFFFSGASIPMAFSAGALERMRISAAGGVSIGTTTDAGATNLLVAGRIVSGGVVRLKGYTFATLPAGTQGDKAFITDGAASPTFRANAAGGGSTVTEVFFNGTNWINS